MACGAEPDVQKLIATKRSDRHERLKTLALTIITFLFIVELYRSFHHVMLSGIVDSLVRDFRPTACSLHMQLTIYPLQQTLDRRFTTDGILVPSRHSSG